jgi:predicted DCC family thiol-disulfide oxidoreductase YuxK
MAERWTGGQYSIYRALLGTYMLAHFAMLLPYGSELFAAGGTVAEGAMSPLFGVLPNPLLLSDGAMAVLVLLALGCVCAFALAVGWWDRAVAVLAALVLGWLFQRNPLIANPSLPLFGWLLVLHAFVPPRPYGSVAALRRGADPAWRLPAHLYFAVWVMLALCYSHSGWTKLASPSWVDGDTIRLVLENPLARDHSLRQWVLATPPIMLEALTWFVLVVELLFAPLALSRRLRPWLWLAMLFAQFGFLAFLDFADLTAPMLLVHLLTFDPAWLARWEIKSPAIVLFDGDCAFCHASIRLAMHEDADARLQFAPLGGATAQRFLGANAEPSDGDSIAVVGGDGRVERKSRAVGAVLERIGGLWLVPAAVLRLLPRAVSNGGYDLVGRLRYRIAGRAAACTLPPSAFATRLLE